MVRPTITRTVPLGELTRLEKEDYTTVLKGMIALSRCIFPKGTKGCKIDAIRVSLFGKLAGTMDMVRGMGSAFS